MSFSRSIFALAIALACVGAAALWMYRAATIKQDPTELDLRRALRTRDYALVLAIAKELLKEKSDQPKLLINAGEAATKLENFDEAISFYDQISDEQMPEAAIARWAVGEVHLHRRHMSQAISSFIKSIQLDANQVNARNRLIYLLNLAGRRWEAIPHLFELLRQDQCTVQQLLYLGNTSKAIENEKELKAFLTAFPEDRMPLLGLAKIRMRAGEFKDANEYLVELLEQQPDLVEAHVQLGKLLLDTDPEKLSAWNRRLPSDANNHPETWMTRGQWARDCGQTEAAARCFAEAIRLDPDHLASLNALAQLTQSLGQSHSAEPFIVRASQIEKLLLAIEQIMANEWEYQRLSAGASSGIASARSAQDLEPIKIAATLTMQLGRPWESMAWARHGLSLYETDHELRGLSRQSQALITRLTPRSQADQIAKSIESFRSFGLPDFDSLGPAKPSAASNQNIDSFRMDQFHKVLFKEITDAFDFTYFASRTSPTDGRKMFEFTGGGVGVLDYDSDGWPDVFLAQGCTWPFDGRDSSHTDSLNRNNVAVNSLQRPFQNVTELARIQEAEFGQGVCIGDINSDGFDDVYVCNIGVNQLWINQGDGTFASGSAMFATRSASWTASAAIADLNGDGQAEIYDANYVEGEDVSTRRCNFRGQPRACSPLNFRRSKGCLWAVDHDGIFHDVGSRVIDSKVLEGNALGLVVFRMRNQLTPSIFVANDQVANLLLTSSPDTDSPLGIHFQDEALLTGLAYDGDGKAQACMGIATGDVNGDGALDLLVTNYFDESNTLYLQQAGGSFQDASKSAGLVGPSTKMLGFGTQFIDASLDGDLDLVVLNGHVDDLTHSGIPFKMRAQLFSNDGRGRFVEQANAGRFFESEQLGRSLAWIDFDRDGKQDFVATDLTSPTSLVRNESEAGNFLNLRLVGIRSHRDAVGAEIVVTAGTKKWAQQLVAGCGYMATNSKTINFGLGTANKVDSIDISWPSGTTQQFKDIPSSSFWLAIEGRHELQPLSQ